MFEMPIIIEQNAKQYLIEYSNWFEFEGRIFSFRKKELFDITNIPKRIPFNQASQSWIINRKQLSKYKIKSLIKNEVKIKDVTDLQWYQQEELNHVFNLK